MGKKKNNLKVLENLSGNFTKSFRVPGLDFRYQFNHERYFRCSFSETSEICYNNVWISQNHHSGDTDSNLGFCQKLRLTDDPVCGPPSRLYTTFFPFTLINTCSIFTACGTIKKCFAYFCTWNSCRDFKRWNSPDCVHLVSCYTQIIVL